MYTHIYTYTYIYIGTTEGAVSREAQIWQLAREKTLGIHKNK